MRLEVSRRADLAVQAIAALAPSGVRLKAGELADAIGTTPGFMAQVLNPLVKAGWVRSVPGPTGGYTLTQAGDGVSVLAVIEAVDGPTATGECVVEDRPCDGSSACMLHAAWAKARTSLTRTLADMPAAAWREHAHSS